MAAVLAGGLGAAASHISGARLWEFPIGPATPIHVTAPRSRHRYAEVTFHHATLPDDELTQAHGIPVTTVARTLFDLVSCVPRHRVRALINEAEHRQLTDAVALPDLIERYPGHRGVAVVRGILADGRLGEDRTREELEALFREFVIERDFPRPRFNHPMKIGDQRIVADCVWIEQRVIVELDGAAAHTRRTSFESDRKRDRRLLVAGWRPTRVTWWRLARDANVLERELPALLTETALSDE
jgi:very-short-patch-repair endonuclease